MAKRFIPNTAAIGSQTPFDNIVGLQTVDGGGLTQGNFTFTTTIGEKVNRTFNIGAFSDPISLEDLNIDSLLQSREIIARNYKVYPNLDFSQVTNFSLFGSLSKRLSTSVTKILNYFPAGIELDLINYNLTTGNTAYNITFDNIENETTFTVDVSKIKNPFNIDFTINAAVNLINREFEYSPLRNLSREYLKYSLFLSGIEYQVLDMRPSSSLTGGTLVFVVEGDPFLGQSTTTDSLVIRPNTLYTNKSFNEDFDEVEKFLLNRQIYPAYTAVFDVPKEDNNGQVVLTNQKVTWPLDGQWNLDIRTPDFDSYLSKLSGIATEFDEQKTNLIVRFFTTDAFKEFDTEDQKMTKVLNIYGRNFDEVKKFIDGMANMTSVNYNVGSDIPSQLLKNLAQTLGWDINISPVTEEDFLSSVLGDGKPSTYPGLSSSLTPSEINFQFYRNLILNSAYLFRSKGTRRSIEFLMRLIGAPDFLVEFNEHVYLADQRINMAYFNEQYAQISGGTYVVQNTVYDPTITYNFFGEVYTGFGISQSVVAVDTTRNDYPVDEEGYPKMPTPTDSFFFQLGAGWYQQIPTHTSPEETNINQSVFTGNNPSVQTSLQPFTYGQKYLDRFRSFPYMREGFRLRKVIDNKKSWQPPIFRNSTDAGYNAYYVVQDDRYVINAKNVDLFLNPQLGFAYDVWKMSRQYNYPIPATGLTAPYPQPGGIDWTVINPQPDKKTFFEFLQTFWRTAINVRNRQWITDGKTSGYPTLSSIYWNWLESQTNANIPNDNFTYQNLTEYVQGIGQYWTNLVQQMIPASTIWNGGVKFENSIFQRQKFVYRRQRGCEIIPVPQPPCNCQGPLLPYDCVESSVNFPLYPWLSGEIGATSLSDILYDALYDYLDDNGYVLSDCVSDSLQTTWYVDVEISGTTIAQVPFFIGSGLGGYPTNDEWRSALLNTLSTLITDGYYYNIVDDIIYVYSADCDVSEVNFVINVGIDLSISCS
jgi:hypothetical protein